MSPAADRLVRLLPGYTRSLSRLGVGPPVRSRVAAVVRELARTPELPGPADAEVMIPPTRIAHVRRVPGLALWLWYSATPDVVTIYALTTSASWLWTARVPMVSASMAEAL